MTRLLDAASQVAGDRPGGREAAVSFNQLLVDQAQVSQNLRSPPNVFVRRRTARSRARSAALARRPSQPVQVLADRLAVPSQREAPARMGPPASSASDPQPTYPESGSRHSGPRPSSSPRMAPAALTSSPIDRTARNTAELDGRNTEDTTGVVRTSPAQRLVDPCSAIWIHRLVAELNPHDQ